MSTDSLDMAVMAVTLVGWIGLFLFIFRIDRRIRKLEDR
jgi:CcmD family protein